MDGSSGPETKGHRGTRKPVVKELIATSEADKPENKTEMVLSPVAS
jgi:hypothetical protein